MLKKKPDKKISYLEVSFSDVLVCKKKEDRPYLEVFFQKPENAACHNLGTIAGIIEISDDSEDSSYIVNYLASVIKKEYYSKIKRNPVESFEAALKKANLALAKLAEHENIGWLGKINAILAVVEKNNIHLSQTGKVHAFLIRKTALTDIGEDSEVPEIPHPIKTFVDVLSGRLEKNDKLVMTTRHIFDVFSPEEIKRSALKFPSAEFIQFLKTALGNELDRSAVLVVEAEEKEKIEPAVSLFQKREQLNAFSQASFSKVPTSFSSKIPAEAEEEKTKKLINPEERQNLAKSIQEDLARSNGDFVDKKTGHIYIKEDSFLKEKPFYLNNFLKNIFPKLPRLSLDFQRKKSRPETGKEIADIISPLPAPQKIPKTPKVNRLNDLFFRFSALSKKGWAKFHPWFKKESVALFFSLLRGIWLILGSFKVFLIRKKNSFAAGKNAGRSVKNTAPESKNTSLVRLWPNFSRIKKIYSKFDYAQKIYAVFAVILLLILPYFISRTRDEKREQSLDLEENTTSAILLPTKDENAIEIKNLDQTDLGENDPSDVLNLNGKIFAVGKNMIINTENGTNYPFPENFASPKTVSTMNDLYLVLILNAENKILSWSPANGKFLDNQIAVPDGADIECAKTYLTYLYLLDKKNNQIYRYPRATGGFGEKTDWLKDNLNLSQFEEMAINEDVFLAGADELIKLSRGEKQDFQMEKTALPVKIDKIYTERNSQNVYVLDKTNSRIIKIGLVGNIISQYYNPEIKNAVDLTVDEENKRIYFLTNNSVRSFEANR